jgi:hypothetical protein
LESTPTVRRLIAAQLREDRARAHHGRRRRRRGVGAGRGRHAGRLAGPGAQGRERDPRGAAEEEAGGVVEEERVGSEEGEEHGWGMRGGGRWT